MPSPAHDILVRPVVVDDLEAVRTLRIEALRLNPISFTADLGAAEAKPLGQWREELARASDSDGDVIFVADAGPPAGLVGMAGVYTPAQPKLAHLGTIWGVYVRPAFRGSGVGGQLIRACVDWARDKGLVGLRLSSVSHEADENGAARRCYERCGFVAYGVEPHAVRYEGRLYDETLMALRL